MKIKNNIADIKNGREKKSLGLKGLILVGSLAVGAGLSSLYTSPASYGKKFNNLAKVYVNSEQLWSIKNQKDMDGDKLISPKVSWSEFTYDVYRANKVKDSRGLSRIIRKEDSIYVPREDINPRYDDL